MYTIQDTVYADAGKYLKCGNKVAFQMKASENIEELDLNLDDIQIVNNYAYFNNGLFTQEVNPRWTYGDYKSRIIKKKYSNDDQIAIMLNKYDSEDDQMYYQKMQEWREFASLFAKKILEIYLYDKV